MTHYDTSALAAYNSLADPHLQSYFSNERIQSHLRHAGLVNQRGEILSEGEYRTKLAQREHRKHVRHMLAENIVSRAIDIERVRLAKDRRQHEALAKAAMVNNIKESRRRSAGFSPFTSSSVDFNTLTFDSRPRSANFQGNSDNEDRMNRNSRYSSAKGTRDGVDDDNDDYRLDRPRKKSAGRRMRRRQSAQRGKSLSGSISKRKSVDSSSNSSPCRITMVYLGPHMKVDFDRLVFDDLDEIIVMQQHCGGENRTVFKSFLKAGDEFQFPSRRHADYPFGLTFYVKGLFDSRISTCCEYKHRHGVRLGGDRGHFAIKSVQGSKPCIKCRFEKEAMLKKMSESPKTKTEENSTSITIPVTTLEKKNDRTTPVRIPLHTPDRHTSVSNEDYDNDFEETKEKGRTRSPDRWSSQSERSVREVKKKSPIKSPEESPTERKSSIDSRRETPTKKKSSIDSTQQIPKKKSLNSDDEEKSHCQLMIFPSNKQIDSQLKNYFLDIYLIDDDGETLNEKINLKTVIDRFDSSLKFDLRNTIEPTKIQLKLLLHKNDDEDEDEEEIQWNIDRIDFLHNKGKTPIEFRSTKPIERLRLTTFVQQRQISNRSRRSSSRSTNEKLSKSTEDEVRRPSSNRKPRIEYQLELYPSDHADGSLKFDRKAKFYLRVNSEEILLEDFEDFQPGEKQSFSILLREELDQIPSLSIGFVNEHDQARRWKLKKIILKNIEKNEEKIFFSSKEFIRDDSTFGAELEFCQDEENEETPRAEEKNEKKISSSRSSSISFPELNDDEAHYRKIFQQLDPKNELNLGSEPSTPRRKSPIVVDPLPNLEDLQQQENSSRRPQQPKTFTTMYSNDEDDDDFN